jgi:hypothetical protein
MPRIPDVRTTFNNVSITKFDVATTSLELNINMTISVTNANPYDISMSSLKMNVFERTSNTLYGIATYPATVVFDSGTTTARTLSLSYTHTNKNITNLLSIASTCSVLGSRNLPVLLKGTFDAYVQYINYPISRDLEKKGDLPCCFGPGC